MLMQCTNKEIEYKVRTVSVTDVAQQITLLMTSCALQRMPDVKSVGKQVILLGFANHLLHQ